MKKPSTILAQRRKSTWVISREPIEPASILAAQQKGHLEITRLLDAGSDIKDRDMATQRTVLSKAVASGSLASVMILYRGERIPMRLIAKDVPRYIGRQNVICRTSKTFTLGHPILPQTGETMSSGWILERIALYARHMDASCMDQDLIISSK